MRVLVGLLLLCIVSIIAAQPICQGYGQDCSCDTDQTRVDPNAVCSNGTWTMGSNGSTLVIPSDYVWGIGYDNIILHGSLDLKPNGMLQVGIILQNKTTEDGQSEILKKTGTLTVIDGHLELDGLIVLNFDYADPGSWAIEPLFWVNSTIERDNVAFMPVYSPDIKRCRVIGNDTWQSWNNNRLYLQFTIAQTSSICVFDKGPRQWVLTWLIIAGATMVVVCLFALLTCTIPPFKRALWYPPKM